MVDIRNNGYVVFLALEGETNDEKESEVFARAFGIWDLCNPFNVSGSTKRKVSKSL
jgi:hypothetical protein